jgi:hypothetical protein
MMKDIFVDRLGNIAVTNGIARLDFLRLAAVDTEKKSVTMEPSVRLVLPMDALLQMMQMLDQMKAQMAKDQATLKAKSDSDKPIL